MHNPSHSGFYDRGPPTHFRNWNEHGYTPPYHYAKQHNGHHVRQFHHHHSTYHYDWNSHHVPHFHRPPFHSSPPSQIIHNNWRHAHPQPVPKIIIQRSSIREEKGKVLRLSGNSKSPPLYHVKTNSLAVSGPSPKNSGEINLPQEKKLFSGRKEKKVRKEAIFVNEKFSEPSAIKPALNVVVSSDVSDKEIKEAPPNTSEGISQKDINSDNPSGQQISSAGVTVTHSNNGGEIKPIHSNSDICVSKDSPINFSNPLTDRDNSKREDSGDLKRDFSVKDNTEKMEFNVSKSYNMKNCKRNSLVKLKKRYPELQKLFVKDPLIKLRRLSVAKIASYVSSKSQETKGHIIGSISERKGLELNKENKIIGGISVDPKVMSLSRTLQNSPNGKKPVETIFKCTVSRLKSANPSPKSKRDAPKISYTDISKLKMKLKNIEVPRSPNISSKTSHIKSINPEPSSETKQKGSICLDKSSVSCSVSLNEHSQEHTITRFSKKEFNHITAFTSVTNENETEMKTCNSEIARTETDKCSLLGNAPTSSQNNTESDQTLSDSMPALTIRRDDQLQETGQMFTSECTPSPPLLEPQVVLECSSLEPVEGQSYASDLGRQVDLQGDSLCDKTMHKLVKEEIMQKKETVRSINSASLLSQGTFQSESFDDRQKVDSRDSKTPQREEGEELKTDFGQRQVSGELNTSCTGDRRADIIQRDRTLIAPCSKPVISERHTDSISCPPSDLDSSVKGESMKNSVVAMDSTPYPAGEELRTSAVLGRAPVWQYNCSEEMLIAADTLLSVANLPACGTTETVGNENYSMDKSSFYQTEYVTCPEETVGLDLTVNSNTTKDNTIVDSVISVGENKFDDVTENCDIGGENKFDDVTENCDTGGENKFDDVTENCDTGIEADNNSVKRKRLKVGKREKVNNDKVEKQGEEEESQACDSDATYIYSDSGEDSTMNQVVEGVQEKGKDGSLPSGNSKKLSDLKKDSKSTKNSSNSQKANNGQKKGRGKSSYVVKSRVKGSPSELVENNKVSDGTGQKQKRKLSQDNDMVIKRKKASPSLKVVIGKVNSAKVNEAHVNKNSDGDDKSGSGKNVSESKEIKSKKAKGNKEIPVKENVNARKKKTESIKKASGAKDLNRVSIDKSDKQFPNIVQSGSPEEEAEEIKKSEGISTTAKRTDSVGRRGKRLGGRRGGITRADSFQKDTGPQQSAEEVKARRGKGSRGGKGRGQKTFTRVVKRNGKDLQIHLNEVLHRGEDSDDLPTILPPKRRRRPQHTTSHQSSDKMDRIMAEFPKHNWLITKYQSEPEDLSLCDSKKTEEVQLADKTAEDYDSNQPLTVQEDLKTDQNDVERLDLPDQNELEMLDLPDQNEPEGLGLPDQNELDRLDLPAKHPEPEKENKDDGEVTEEDSFDSPLYIDMDSVNEKEVDEDSPNPKQHPLDLCVKKNDKASVTFRQHSNPPVQLVHPHVHRPPTSGSFGQLSNVSNILLRDTKLALSNMVVSSQSSDITQGIVRKISADWSTSSAGSVITGTSGDLISEIIDLGKSIHVPENLLKHGVLPSPFCNDISNVQVLHDSCSKKDDISDKKQEPSESEAKFVQPAIPKLIPASSLVPGSIFSPSQLTENQEIVLLPVSLGPSTDIVVSDVNHGQCNISNSQGIQVENAVSMRNDATNISENRNYTSKDRTHKVGGKDEQLYPSTRLCSSAVQMTSSSNETDIVIINDDSTAFTTLSTINCPSLLPEEHSAPLSFNPDVRILESTLVASHLSQGSIPATSISTTTSIGSIKLSDVSDLDICDIKSNSESIGNDSFLSTTIPKIPEKKTNVEMQPNSSVKTPGSECGTVDSSISTHIKSLKTDIYLSDKHNAVGAMGKGSVNMADSNLDMTEGEPPTKRYCEYPSSMEPPPLMMAQKLVDAESVSPDQNISCLANDNTLRICSPVQNTVAELDPEIQKQIEELDKKIQQNEKEKQEMLNAKKKMAELMERKKREKLEEQAKVISKEEQHPMAIENVPVQTAVGMQDPLYHLPLSISNQETLKVNNSHEEQPWSKYQSPFNESSCLEQQSAVFQEPTSGQQQELPQPHSREKQTPYQLPVSLYQPPLRQNLQQKQKEQQEHTLDQLLVQSPSFQQQATPRSQNIHEQQQQNIPYQQQQPSQHQRRSMSQHTMLHDKPSLFQQPSSPSQMSQTSQGFLQCPPLTERASFQSLSSAENNLPNRIQHQQPTSQQQNQTSLKQMIQIQNSQQQNIQGSNVPRQQLLQQQLFSGQQPNQLAGSQFQQQQVVSQQRFHLQSPLHMQPSQAAPTQSPAHLQHGFQHQYHSPQHPSLTQQQQYSQTQQQNYYNPQTQLQPQQQQFQQNFVKNQTPSQTHSIAPGHSSAPTVPNMQRPNMQHQRQMQHYQQMRMQQQQQQQQQPRPQLIQARPSNFGNTFQMPSSQRHEMQSGVKQNNSHELQCNLNPMGPKNVSPCPSITGTANVTPTVPRQITLAMQEAQRRKQFGLPEIQPAHCNNEKSLLRRDSEPPPPAHMNCVSLKKLMRKMDRNAIKLTSTIKASCPYVQRNEPITCPPLDAKKTGNNEMKAPAKAHSQPPFNIAGKLIIQQLPGKTPSINRSNNEDKEAARHSSVPNTPTSATLGVQLPPRASSASDRHLQKSQSIFETGHSTFAFHPNSPSSATLSRSASSSQTFTNLSIPEESKFTDKGNTLPVALLNSQQKAEGSVNFTNTSQTFAPPAIQSQDAIATQNIDNTNIIDLTKEFSTVQNLNEPQKDDTEKAVQLELNKAIAKRCKQDLQNATMAVEDWTQFDQQPSKASPHQTQGMKLPLGPSSTIVLTVDNQPHAQQASLQVSPVLVSTPMHGIQNQQQQWQRVSEEMNPKKSVLVSPPPKQLPINQGPGLMMRPSSGMQVTAVSNVSSMHTPSNRLSSGQGGRMPHLLPKVQAPMIRMIGSAAVPVQGVLMPPTAGNMQINRLCHPQTVMMQAPYTMNQQHLQAQRQYQNPEIMKHGTRQNIGAQRAGIVPRQQIPLQNSVEIIQDSNSCVHPVQQQPQLNPSAQANAFNQNRQQLHQLTSSPQQAFVPMSYQRQTTSSQARFVPLATYVNSSGHGQHMHTQNSMIMGNEQLEHWTSHAQECRESTTT
ncbi:hypothetical protein ACJMK2_012201 [Sinanodonta woodiana]|uniref:Uncharacterized protein n=1 Tax=Sinanodonta woodiana TaxID=1069815 RepID=A0ABD3VAC4_SINWO